MIMQKSGGSPFWGRRDMTEGAQEFYRAIRS